MAALRPVPRNANGLRFLLTALLPAEESPCPGARMGSASATGMPG